MKQLLLLLACSAALLAHAQHTDSTQTNANMAAAWQNLNSGRQNAPKAFALFTQCAQAGNAEAMNALGIQYKTGLGTTTNQQKSIEWFTKAANAGYAKAWYNLGLAYKEQLDFTKAYEGFNKAAALNVPLGVYSKGYMLYKGLGCTQNYPQAVAQFYQAIQLNNTNAMYFMGLCYRNGYGIAQNKDSAKYWLLEAASRGYQMATDELMAKEPEHVATAGTLATKIQAAQAAMPKNNAVNQYQRIEHQVAVSDVAGIYTGYLLKYDWSGKNVIEADKLSVTINYVNDSIKGVWQENDSLTVPLNAKLTPQALVFGKMQYRKTNHYSPTKAELTVFEKAKLQLTKTADGVYLSGNIQQFIPTRNEPAKPLYVALVRTGSVKSNDVINVVNEDGTLLTAATLRAYPNPFGSSLTLDFELIEKCEVVTQLLTLDGKMVYSNPAGILTAGHYTLPIQTQQVASGYYTLVLRCGKKARTTKVVKL